MAISIAIATSIICTTIEIEFVIDIAIFYPLLVRLGSYNRMTNFNYKKKSFEKYSQSSFFI